MKKKIMSVLLAGIMTLGITGCGGDTKTNETTTSANNNQETTTKANETTGTQTNTGEPKVLKMDIPSEFPNMDPQTSTDAASSEITNAVLEGLIRVYEGEIIPGMAEKWEISTDGLTYTFHLRDANWSDGVPVTAKDFEYTIKRLLNPDTGAQYAYQGYYIKGGEAFNTGSGAEADLGVKAIDDKTLEIVLETPTAYFLSLLNFSTYLPVRQDIVEKYGDKFAADADKFVYNGPFIMENWLHDEELILVKNEEYWAKDKINLTGAEFIIVPNAKTALFMYEEGELDVIQLNKDTMAPFVADGSAKYYYDGALWYLEINAVHEDPVKNKLFTNQNFKQALGYAIDRRSFVDAVLKNGSDPAGRFVLPLVAGPTEGKTFDEEYPYSVYPENGDLNKAKELLNKALSELNMTIDQVPAIEYLTDDTETARLISEAFQAMVKEIGITFDIKQVPFKQRLELMSAQKFDVVMAGWGPDYDDPMTYMDLFITDGGNNHSKWSNARYDELILGAKAEVNAKKRADMMFEAEKILLEEAAVVPIYNRRIAYLQQSYVSEFPRNFYGAVRDFIYADIDLNSKK